MEFFAYEGTCLCPLDGGPVPYGAQRVCNPFGPLLIYVSRDPSVARGVFAIERWSDIESGEGVERIKRGVLLPPEHAETLVRLMRAGQVTGINRAFPRLSNAYRPPQIDFNRRVRIHIIGLGDVGGTFATGLRLLGGDRLTAIGVFDPDINRCRRYELELNQVLPLHPDTPTPPVQIITEDGLFDCDVLAFTASRGVPPVAGTAVNQDVRLVQYEKNLEILKPYAIAARERHFHGLFAVVSDPVDQLSRALFLESNRDASGALDFCGLLPEQVRGYGLGVMAARANYLETQRGRTDFLRSGRAFGPHGHGLVIANDVGDSYDDEYSDRLTAEVETANHSVRATGFKPYIAPGLSSACVSILQTISGQYHYAAVPMRGAYFGCRAIIRKNGPATETYDALPDALLARIIASHRLLEDFPC